MKLVTYLDGCEKVGLLTSEGIISMDELGFPFDSMQELIQGWSSQVRESIEGKLKEYPLKEKARDYPLLAPIPKPEQDIICLGLNYAEHAMEARQYSSTFEAEKADAVYFSKRANYCSGPFDDIPSHSEITNRLDYESELAVIIGKDATKVREEEVEEYIFGYTIVNDVTARDLQNKHKQWYFGKSLDGFTPMGPCIVTADEISYPPKLSIQSYVNGELRQDSNTRELIHGIGEIISELSSGMTLRAGTIIATGTPKGVAMGMRRPVFLKPGDEVVCKIEGIGEIRNKVR